MKVVAVTFIVVLSLAALLFYANASQATSPSIIEIAKTCKSISSMAEVIAASRDAGMRKSTHIDIVANNTTLEPKFREMAYNMIDLIHGDYRYRSPVIIKEKAFSDCMYGFTYGFR